MKISGENGGRLELLVTGYVFPESQNELFASDWLKAAVKIQTIDCRTLNLPLEFLLVEEIEHLLEWVCQIHLSKQTTKRFQFIDAELSCFFLKRAGRKQLKWILRFGEKEKECLDFELHEENVRHLVKQLKDLLVRYPCRCEIPHPDLAHAQRRENLSMVYDEYPDVQALEIHSRQFKQPCQSKHEELCGNLYHWLKQTRQVLWQYDKKANRVTLYTATIVKLGERFATMERIPKSSGASLMMELVIELAKEEKKQLEIIAQEELNEIELFTNVLNRKTDLVERNFIERYIQLFLTKPKLESNA